MRFVDFKITLMLHCGNEFRMEVCSFCFKFDDIVPRKGKIISSSFFGAAKYTCFGKLQKKGAPTKRISALFRFKDVIPKELRSHLIYKFACSSCNATYFGKKERHLNVRSGEHMGLSPLTGNRVACKPSTISDHLLLHEHNNNSFNDFSILCCENNAYKLSLRE